MDPILVPAAELDMRWISAGDTVRLAVLTGPEHGPVTTCLESWEPGGAQPFNSHPGSTEVFVVLAGGGLAECDGVQREITAGDTLVLPAGTLHRITNTGTGRMYTLTLMSPDDGFADLVRRGPVAFTDDDDRAALGHATMAAQR